MGQCTASSKQTGERCKRYASPGKQTCYYHGGKSLGGIASPTLKVGRYSKFIPASLSEKYQAALCDEDVLSLNEDVALLRSFVLKHLSDIATGDTHPAWIEAKRAFDEMEAAGAQGVAGLEKYMNAKLRLQLIIEPNYRAAISEGQVVRYVDQLGKLADKERRLLIDRQQVISVERMMILLTAIVASVKQHVNDRVILNAIQNDIQGLISTGS